MSNVTLTTPPRDPTLHPVANLVFLKFKRLDEVVFLLKRTISDILQGPHGSADQTLSSSGVQHSIQESQLEKENEMLKRRNAELLRELKNTRSSITRNLTNITTSNTPATPTQASPPPTPKSSITPGLGSTIAWSQPATPATQASKDPTISISRFSKSQSFLFSSTFVNGVIVAPDTSSKVFREPVSLDPPLHTFIASYDPLLQHLFQNYANGHPVAKVTLEPILYIFTMCIDFSLFVS